MELVDVKELQADVLEALNNLRNTMRRSIQETWIVGASLCRLRESCSHGEYSKWLDEIGVPERQARRFVELYNKYPDKMQVLVFDNVKEAMLSHPDDYQDIQEAVAYVKKHAKRFEKDTVLKCGIVLPGLGKISEKDVLGTIVHNH